MAKVEKARHWCFEVYPPEPDGGGAPEDWLERLRLSGLRCAISPLHDKDKCSDPKEANYGMLKKPHWHVIACWDGGSTTYNVARELSQGKLNGTIPVKLNGVRGYYRYLTHMDDPDKYQYDPSGIQHLNGFDILDYIEMTMSERIQLTKRIQRYIRECNILEYADLLDTLLDNEEDEMYTVAIGNTLLFRGYIQSRAGIAFRQACREEAAEQRESDRENVESFAAQYEREGKRMADE